MLVLIPKVSSLRQLQNRSNRTISAAVSSSIRQMGGLSASVLGGSSINISHSNRKSMPDAPQDATGERRNYHMQTARQSNQMQQYQQQQHRTVSTSIHSPFLVNSNSNSNDTNAVNEAARWMSSTAQHPSYDNILVDTQAKPGVALITLNRPKAMNALNDALFDDLLHATKILNDDDTVGCIVLTGSAKAFAAGADISEMSQRTYEEVYRNDMFSQWQTLVTQTASRTPIIAAVSGFCLGGGCELAMMCDIMLCSESAKFGQPEINLGVIPGAGGTQRLTRAVGKSKAMLWTLTGDFWSAEEAYQSGLVAQVFANDELLEKSLGIAEKISKKGRLSVQACKEAVNASQELPLEEGLRLERRLFHGLFATEDQKEGMAAFLEKREANFKR